MIAMEFTSQYIHLVEGSASGNNVTVKNTLSVPVPERSVRNGQVQNYEDILRVLESVFMEQNYKKPQIAFSLDSTAIKTKHMELPYETKEKALLFMRHELGELIADETYIIDYVIHKIFRKGKAQYMECTAYAIPRDLLKEYSNLCKGLGAKLKIMDILGDVVAKQLELQYPKLQYKGAIEVKPKKKKKSQPKKKGKKKNIEEEERLEEVEEDTKTLQLEEFYDKGALKLWVGIYDEKMKLFTNGIDGKVFSRTIMLEGLSNTAAETQGEAEREQILTYIEEIKKFLQFQEDIAPDTPIQSIEMFGEHPRLAEICEFTSQLAERKSSIIQKPKQIKGVSPAEYAKYMGAIGCLLRRA
jgi:Tfp pilus assembly protein, ATPase PilM